MEFDNTEYFGSYEHSNIEQIIEYMKKMNQQLAPIYDFGKPFMKSGPTENYIDYLLDRRLNQKPLSAEQSFEYIAPLFRNVPNWNNPGTMINVIPPVNLVAMTTSFFSTLYSSNFAQDTYAGSLINAELEVSKYVSDLLDWNWKESYGTFTFGGKGTNLYAAKVALTKANPKTVADGIGKNEYFMVTSQNAHPCHYEVCGWIGIGKNGCVEVPCNDDGKMNIEKAEQIIRAGIESGKTFIGFNLNGGSTNELYVDPVKEVYLLNQRIVQEYSLNYTPHIHVDAVLSWIYLFFNEYDSLKNPLNIDEVTWGKISSLNKEVKELKYADSIGLDFHKTGFSPYVSSMFITKNRADFYAINDTPKLSLEDLEYGNYNPYQTTLELTRSSLGPVAALSSLKSLGVEGFQKIISDMFAATEHFRAELSKQDDMSIINTDAVWLATFFVLKPEKYRGLDLDQMVKLPSAEIDEIRNYNIDYAKFIREKAERGESSFIYTSSRSYKIPGTQISLGALKAYPMSPFLTVNTSKKIISDVINSVEEYKSKLTNNFSNLNYISDEMVYREHK